MQRISSKQKVLLETLAHHLPSGSRNLAKSLGEILKLDSSNVYRRLRGETELTFSELYLISKQFPQLSTILDRTWNAGRRTKADLYSMNNWSQVQNYLRCLIKSLSQASDSNNDVFCNCREASMYITLRTEPLIRRGFGHAQKQFGPISAEAVPAPVIRLCKELLQVYDRTSTVEIWHLHGWLDYLQRLRFLFVSQLIQSGELAQICTELKLWLLKFRNMAMEGRKSGGGKFVLHISEYKELNDSTLFNGQTQCFLGSSLDPSVLATDDRSNIKLVKSSWNQQVQASQEVSGANSRYRNIIFNQISAEVDKLLYSCNGNKNAVVF